MATPEQVAQAHYADQAGLVQQIADLILALGRNLRLDEVQRWFGGPAQVLQQALIEAQRLAAQAGAAYVPAALAAAGQVLSAVPHVIPEALSGRAADGRPLDSLLALPIVRGRRLVEQGMPEPQARRRVVAELTMIGRTEVADAGRVATGVEIAATPQVAGYVRLLQMPSCSRCIVLAGMFFKTTEGFLRHPNCDCIHVPVASREQAAELRQTGGRDAVLAAMSDAEMDKTFGRADAKAIRDGADLGQVVNARRSLYTTADGKKATWMGTTRRGLAGRRLGAPRGGRARTARLTPEEIYKQARGDRDEARRLLHRYGYIVRLDGPIPERPARDRADLRPVPPEPQARPAPAPAPQPEPEPVAEPAPAEPSRPLLADLIPHDELEGMQRASEIEAVMREQLEQRFDGIDIRVDDVRVNKGRIAVDARAYTPEGRQVGMVERRFYRDDAGKLWAYHSLLDLDPSLQGKGFADAFNGHLTGWYRESNFDRVELLANIDVGGYAWASKGFDFKDEESAKVIFDELRSMVSRGIGDSEGLALAQELLDRADRLPFGHDDYPTAREVSQLGRQPGQGKADSWIGKRAMLGSAWQGVLWL